MVGAYKRTDRQTDGHCWNYKKKSRSHFERIRQSINNACRPLKPVLRRPEATSRREATSNDRRIVSLGNAIMHLTIYAVSFPAVAVASATGYLLCLPEDGCLGWVGLGGLLQPDGLPISQTNRARRKTTSLFEINVLYHYRQSPPPRYLTREKLDGDSACSSVLGQTGRRPVVMLSIHQSTNSAGLFGKVLLFLLFLFISNAHQHFKPPALPVGVG